MPHGLTILTATMTGGVVGAPAAANTAGCCCPCCPAWCATYCPACCTTAAPAAVPAIGVPHAAGVAAVPGAYTPAATVPAASPLPASIPPSLPGGWGSSGGPLPPLSYPAPAGGAGYYSGNPPALTGAMSLFTTGRDRAGQLLKQLRDSAMAWGSDGHNLASVPTTGVAEPEKEGKEETKGSGVWRRSSRSTTTASSGDRQNNGPRWTGRTVRRSDGGSRSCRSEEGSSETVVFCGVAVEEDEEVGRGSHAFVFL